MRALLLPFLVLVVGCSNACPAPVSCDLPHPDYCPCNVPPRPDAYMEPVDAFMPASDAGVDAGTDANAIDSGLDAAVDSGVDGG